MMKPVIILLTALFLNITVHSQTNSTNNLMPVPKELKVTEGQFTIDSRFRVSVTGSAGDAVYAEASRFIRRLSDRTGIFLDKQGFVKRSDHIPNAALTILVKRSAKLVLGENEQYSINISNNKIRVTAETDLGATHALETLLQLVSTNEKGYYFPGLIINDEPRFRWRGLLLDVALHFMPINVLRRNIDGMAAVKMNVLHLHLCNDQGFRVESKVFPQLQKLASDGKYYTQEEIRGIIKYAAQRGIRIVPEFVVPAHTTAILTAFPELASVKKNYTLERYFGVFDPVMDPTNNKVYVFIEKLYAEMAALFPDLYFHIGGDENTGKDWESTPHIKQYMKSKGMKHYMDLQTEFNKKIQPIVKKNGKIMMGWDEILQPGVPKDVIIQSWRGNEAYYKSIRDGYRAILSYGYYIDLIQPTDYHYLNDPIPDSIKLTAEQTQRVLGGEATMWSELITPETVDSRIWPRLAAIAERLWSPHEVNSVPDMYRRLSITSIQLESVGLQHLSFKPVFLRRLANGADTKAVENLVNVIEPLKIYERNSGDTMYTVFSPFTKIADVATPDQELPRLFNNMVNEYLKSRSGNIEKQITDQLTTWKNNHADFELILKNSPVLAEAEILSKNLSLVAQTGLEAIQFLRGGTTPGKSWLEDQQHILQEARVPGGRCELQVINPIQKLAEAAAGDGVQRVYGFGNTCSLH